MSFIEQNDDIIPSKLIVNDRLLMQESVLWSLFFKFRQIGNSSEETGEHYSFKLVSIVL